MKYLKDSIKILHGFLLRWLLPIISLPPNQLYKGKIYTAHRVNIIQFLDSWHNRIHGSVLNAGSGSWEYPRQLFSARCEFIATDHNEGPGVDIRSDIHKLTDFFPKERFDFVICIDVLEHVERPWLAVRQLWEVLKPGGMLLMTVPFNFNLHGYAHVVDYWRMTADGIETLLIAEAGFREINITSRGHPKFPFTYLVEAKK